MKTAAHISLSGDRPSRWGGITGNIADQADLNTILDSFADDLNDLTGEVETKASAAAVVQALFTKADLVDGVIPASQLPSYVDDVLVYPTWADFPVTGEAGKIYVTEDTNKTYRWSGSGYVVIADGVALGETSSTAYRGDNGKIAYDHSLSQGNPHNATTSDIPEGTRLYFTEDRVLQAALIGLNTTNPAPVTATDALLAAIGKLQAQINNVGSSGGGSSGGITWVDVKTIGTVNSLIDNSYTKIEVAKINGMLWLRGVIHYSTTSFTGTVFTVNHSSYRLTIKKPPAHGQYYNPATSPTLTSTFKIAQSTGAGVINESYIFVNPAGDFCGQATYTFNSNMQYLLIPATPIGQLLN